MKNVVKHFIILLVLVSVHVMMPPNRASGQVLTTLHVFNPNGAYDAANPYAGMVLSSNTLFGTAEAQATYGAVFRINTDGSGYAVYGMDYYTDGGGPTDTPLVTNNTIYATSSYGGSNNQGTVFLMTTNGYDTNLYNFPAISGAVGSNSDGAQPYGGVVLSSNVLYGTAQLGGTAGNGSIFSLHINGSGFTNLHSFSALSAPYYDGGTNTDGANPYDTLVIWSNQLFGTTRYGGRAGNGVIFRIGLDGSGFTNVHDFSTIVGVTNGDGAKPEAGLIVSGNTLYGTASAGGTGGYGTVFALNAVSLDFATLHDFAYATGAAPYTSVVLSGNMLYGATYVGGTGSVGVVYQVKVDGTGFAVLHNFTQVNGTMNIDGAYPDGNLVVSSNVLYGTTQAGGTNGFGTIFSLPIGPQLGSIRSGTNLVFTWATNQPVFNLQNTTNLTPPVTWTNVSNAVLIVNGQNTVTNSSTGPSKYYRLAR
jgi:uncharacterized repeat protein (TIGR03803 family)